MQNKYFKKIIHMILAVMGSTIDVPAHCIKGKRELLSLAIKEQDLLPFRTRKFEQTKDLLIHAIC